MGTRQLGRGRACFPKLVRMAKTQRSFSGLQVITLANKIASSVPASHKPAVGATRLTDLTTCMASPLPLFLAATDCLFSHINATDKDENEDYLVSGRHVSTVYKIAGLKNKVYSYAPGEIIWRLGGKNNAFTAMNSIVPSAPNLCVTTLRLRKARHCSISVLL